MQVKDMYGNAIEVRCLKTAIEQAERLSTSPFKKQPFTIVNGNSTPIKGREHETHTVGEYHKDLLYKLNKISVIEDK